MSAWGRTAFGQPCTECGFDWDIKPDRAAKIIDDAPDRYTELLADATGQESAPELGWNAVGYVSHVTDNLRIWAERFAAARQNEQLRLIGYDDEQLAIARRYNDLDLSGALWSLRQAARSWNEAWELSERSTTMLHAQRGPITMADCAVTNAHDVEHHHHDIGRCLHSSHGTLRS